MGILAASAVDAASRALHNIRMQFVVKLPLPLLLLTLLNVMATVAPAVEPWPGAERRLARVPTAEADLSAAHDQAAAFSAQVVPAHRPFECLDGTEHLTVPATPVALRVACNRSSVLAMGSDMHPADQKRLPFFSGKIILDEVNAYFLSVQIRAATSAMGVPYLLDRPQIVVTKYQDSAAALPSTEIVDVSVRDMRSLGFLTHSNAPNVDPPRTMAIAIRNIVTDDPPSVAKPALVARFEIVFVHARADATGQTLVIHAFGTTHDRTKLHRFAPIGQPKQLSDCAIQGAIFFTDYALAGQYPTAKATRSVKLNSTQSFDVAQIDRWLTARGVQGDTWSHLPLVFDAIVDGQLTEAK